MCSIRDLNRYLLEEIQANRIDRTMGLRLLKQLNVKEETTSAEVAVIGMSCRFPGAQNWEEFWNNLQNGICSIGNFPESRRKDIDFLLSGLFPLEEEIYVREGFLEQIDGFDASFFRISPREAELMDPYQRLFLETTWEALEDAGLGGTSIFGTETGVFAGRDHTSEFRYKKLISEFDSLVAAGSCTGILASRISYILNLKGPSIVVDTACSSGLVAVHLACRALQNKECEIAIAGGINLNFLPLKKYYGSNIDSVDNILRAFDKKANGTVWGEGVGVVVLKSLNTAIADRDNIHAVIKGSAINNDGASNGITAPNARAQEEVLLKAWKTAGINPETISYLEAHGTGTGLGDPIEVEGLTSAFRRFSNKRQFCGIGSVKTNVGHLVGAAGIVSLLKTILMLKYKAIPASLNFDEPNPLINFCESPLYVNDRLRLWEREGTSRRAGVSAFGFSGTNCHLVLEEAPDNPEIASSFLEPEVFTLSARNKQALQKLISRFAAFINRDTPLDLGNICYTVNTGRGYYSYRLALLFHDENDFKEKIALLNRVDPEQIEQTGVYYGTHRVVAEEKISHDAGDLTENEKYRLTETANRHLEQFLSTRTGTAVFPEQFCRWYVQGADLEWDKLYRSKNRKRISLPVYPFSNTRYWVKPGLFEKENGPKRLHPLLDCCLATSIYQDIYTTEFRVDTHWVLKEHLIMGHCTIPGTTYLEMARAISLQYYSAGAALEIKDVLFYSPLVVEVGETVEVQTVIQKEEEHLEFTVASKLPDQGEGFDWNWRKHASGIIGKFEVSCRPYRNRAEIISRCNQGEFTIDLTASSGVFKFGPRWSNIERVYVGAQEALVKVKLPEEYQGDLEKYFVHPALLDTAVNAVSMIPGKKVYLPLSYKSFRIYGALPSEFYSHLYKKEDPAGSEETVSFDITLLAETGEVIIEIKDYTIKVAPQVELQFQEKSKTEVGYYQTAWVPESLPEAKFTGTGGTVMVLKDQGGFGAAIIQKLKNNSFQTIEVELGPFFEKKNQDYYQITGAETDYPKLLQELKNRQISRILHLTTCSSGSESVKTVDDFNQGLKKSIYSLFYLTKAIINGENSNHNLEIILIAEYANQVTGGESRLNPQHAAFFGLGKVVGQEYPQLSCRCIDIDGDFTVNDLESELQVSDPKFQVAYRNGQRFSQELRAVDLQSKKEREIDLREEGVYLITGGTGGLGLEIGKFLTAWKKINLCLANRFQLPGREKWPEILNGTGDWKTYRKIKAIQQMEQNGATVLCRAADITKEDEIRPLLNELRGKYGKINGVIHCAGVAGEGLLFRKEMKSFHAVTAPKILGTWIIDQLTIDDNLDFFILFSSTAAFLGGAGQGDYTAGNAYLNAYSGFRNRKGKRTLSICWPAWAETGMAVDYGANIDGIFKTITTSDALREFTKVWSRDLGTVIIGELNHHYLEMDLNKKLPVDLSSALQARITQKSKWRDRNRPQPKDVKLILTGKKDGNYTDTERKIAEIWSEVLGISEINIYDSLYDLGGDSLLALKIANRVNQETGKSISIAEIFNYLTINKFAGFFDLKNRAKEVELDENPYSLIKPVEKSEYYPLSFAQKRLYILSQIEREAIIYNIPMILLVEGELDIQRVEQIFEILIKRHEALRTSFELKNGEPAQIVNEDPEFKMEYEELPEEKVKEAINRFIRPYELTQAPLFRAGLIKITKNKYCLMFDIHHLIADAVSFGILIREFAAIYEGVNLPKLKLQYKDYAVWQNRMYVTEVFRKQEKYWFDLFRKGVPFLDLPTDFSRPPLRSFAADSLRFRLGKILSEKLNKLASQTQTTLFMVLMAAYNILLFRYTGKGEIVVGSPITGKPHLDLENTIGIFVNLLAIKNSVQDESTYKELLNQVKENALNAYRHQDYQLMELLSKLSSTKTLEKKPLFSTVFALQNIDVPIYSLYNMNIQGIKIPGLKFSFYEYFQNTVEFDLLVLVFEDSDGLTTEIKYATTLFKKTTIEKFGSRFLEILNQVAGDSDKKISDIAVSHELSAANTNIISEDVSKLDF